MPSKRTIRALHAGAVSAAVVIAIYVLVPQFDELLVSFGPNIPATSRLLIAVYPYAFVLPIIAIGVALLTSESSRGRLYVVPSVYIASVAIVVFVAVALYAPVYKLANESSGQHAP